MTVLDAGTAPEAASKLAKVAARRASLAGHRKSWSVVALNGEEKGHGPIGETEARNLLTGGTPVGETGARR